MIGPPDAREHDPLTEAPALAPAPTATAGTRPNRWRRWTVAAVAVAAIVAAIVFLQRSQSKPATNDAAGTDGYVTFASAGIKLGAGSGQAPKVGQPAPDFALPALDGSVLRPADLRGRVVLLNFWATWCPPCRKEMPLFNQAAADYADRGVVVVAVNIQENRDQVSRFVDEFELRFPVLLDTAGDVTKQYRVQGLPTTVLIDRDGVVREIKVGEFNRAQLDERINRRLAESGR